MAPVNGEAGCYPFSGIEKTNLQVPYAGTDQNSVFGKRIIAATIE